MIPGRNLLAVAFRAIARNKFEWQRFDGNGRTSSGVEIPQYVKTPCLGSVQAADSKEVAALGLDLNLDYIKVYSTVDFFAGGRDASSDRILFNGRLHQIKTSADWFSQDGWTGVLAVHLKGPKV